MVLAFFSATRAAEVDVDAIVREVRAKELVVIFGEYEIGKQYAMDLMAVVAKENPKISFTYWSRVAATLDLDALESAVAKHYAAHFTADELKVMVNLFSPSRMRGLIYWFRQLGQNTPAPEAMAAEIERLRKSYGEAEVAKALELFNSALGRQLIEVQRTVVEVRRKETLAAFESAHQRLLSTR